MPKSNNHRPAEGQRELVPQVEQTLRGADMVGNTFVLSYLEDAHARVRLFDRKGKAAGEIELPGIGTVYPGRGRRNQHCPCVTPGAGTGRRIP